MSITLSLPQLVTLILLTAIVGCTLGMGLLSMLVIGRQSDHDEMGVRLSQSDNDEPTAKELATEIKAQVSQRLKGTLDTYPDMLNDVLAKCDAVINETWRE